MPSLKLEVILLCVLIKSSRFPIVVSSFTVIEPASEPSELYKLMVLCAADIELDMPNSESLELEEINPSDINYYEQLFKEGLGLDSIDALELGMALKRKYDITLESNKEENKKYFYSVSTLADFVESKING